MRRAKYLSQQKMLSQICDRSPLGAPRAGLHGYALRDQHHGAGGAAALQIFVRHPRVLQGVAPADRHGHRAGGDCAEKVIGRGDEIFALGDVAGVPKGKTAASVKWQVPVVEDHLIAAIEGREGTQVYDGYTSCPLITRVGRAMLVEFDYHNNLVPSFPGVIAPLEELWISWLMKEVALKATYNAMLRGKA